MDGYSAFDWIKYLIVATFNFFIKKPKYEKFVIEMGVDKPGDMDFILSMTKADLGIFLSISKVHTENFEDIAEKGEDLLEVVFQEKAKVIKALEENGWAVLNYDVELIRGLGKFTKAKVITFGLKEGADIRGKVKRITSELFEGSISYKNKNSFYTHSKKCRNTENKLVNIPISIPLNFKNTESYLRTLQLSAEKSKFLSKTKVEERKPLRKPRRSNPYICSNKPNIEDMPDKEI